MNLFLSSVMFSVKKVSFPAKTAVSTTYIVEIANQKNESICLTGEIHLLAHLHALCQLRNFPHEFTEKCFAVFDLSSCTIYLTRYQMLLFMRIFFYHSF